MNPIPMDEGGYQKVGAYFFGALGWIYKPYAFQVDITVLELLPVFVV